MKYERTFGEIPGQPEGTPYKSREEARLAKVHAQNQAGISGSPREGADAIVLNGGYLDDQDHGEVIVYTGHGGQDRNKKKQIADQNLDDPGNAALVKSQVEQLPVRVIRGEKEPSRWAPKRGYEYGGLYRVVRHWFKTRSDGFRVCQFLLVKIGSSADIASLGASAGITSEPEDIPAGPAGRTSVTVKKINRIRSVVEKVKNWHDNHCQICGNTVELPIGPSSEAAHIRPLGFPHEGPDSVDNVLCLCPNDHRRFDNGALYLTDDLKVIDALHGSVGELNTHPRHKIRIDFVRYHRSLWQKEP